MLDRECISLLSSRPRFYMADIQLLIGQSSTEGERKKRERTRLQRQKLLPSGKVAIQRRMVAAWLLYVLPVDAMYSDNLSIYSCQTGAPP